MSEENSTTSPGAAHRHIPHAGLFYRVDSSRSTFAELWRDTRSPAVLIAWMSKLLRFKLPGSVNDPNVVSLRPFVLPRNNDEESLPADVMHELAPVVRELTELGFGERVYCLIDDRFHHSKIIQCALLHRDGRTIARVNHRAEGVQSQKIHFFTEFLTELPANNFLHSSSARAQLHAPPQCNLNWRPSTSTSQLWVSHKQELDATGHSATVFKLNSRGEMVDLLERHHEAVRDFQLQRGVFSSMRGEDLAQVQALDRSIEQVPGGQIQNADVMAHLERLQHRKTNLTSALLVLGVSISLFIGLGAAAWKQPWHALLMIAGILLVHEVGHYLAMLIFKYRNVRMFFIPLLGAAVSGHNYTAPGWKKVVVALMGPLPGITIGGILGVVGIAKSNDTMTTVALMFICLNGLQLLPVLPLDGGRVMHALLFSRHYYLDAIFQGVAGIFLLGIGMIFNDKVGWVIGFVMLMGLPATFKVAKIARELRRHGLGAGKVRLATATASLTGSVPLDKATSSTLVVSQTSSNSAEDADLVPRASLLSSAGVGHELIPQPVAELIINKIRDRFQKVKHPRQIAQLALRVYEVIATRPPGISASLGLGFLHGTSLVVAFVMLGVIGIGRHPNWQGLIYANNLNPTRTVQPRDIVEWEARDTSAVSAGSHQRRASKIDSSLNAHKTLIATFATADEAGRAFQEIQQDATVGAYAVQFGQSLLLTLSNAQTPVRWFDRFEGVADDLFIVGDDETGAFFTMTCIAPSGPQAEGIVEELSSFLEADAEMRLIPPWVDGKLDARSDGERSRHSQARVILHKLRAVYVHDAPELEVLRNDLTRASRRSDRAEYERLSAQLTVAQNELLLQELQQVRDDVTSEHHELVDGYIALKIEEQQAAGLWNSDDDEGYGKWVQAMEKIKEQNRAVLGPLLGQWPVGPDGSNQNLNAMRYNYHYGYAMQALAGKLAVAVQFVDPARGAPAIVRWLDGGGCRHFRYEFDAGNPELDWND